MSTGDSHDPQSTAYARLASPQTSPAQDPKSPHDVHPLSRAHWLSQLTMWWMNDVVRRGYHTRIEEDDVWDLPSCDRALSLQRTFDSHYTKESAINGTPPPIHAAMWHATKATMAPAIALYFLSAAASLLQPLIIQALLQWLDGASNTVLGFHSGYALAALLTVTSLVSVSALDFGMFRATRAGIQARTIVVNAVFQKTLLLSSTARQVIHSGDIVTLASVDSERLYEAYANGMWAFVAPVMVVVVCVLIGVILGVRVGLGAAVCAVAILFFAMTNSRQIGQLRRQILHVAGERVQFTNEVLQGIRVVKMYAWEDAVATRVGTIRAREIEMLRRYNYMRATNYVVLTMGQTFMTAVCLVVYVYQGDTLTIPKTFALLAFTNVCRMPFSVFSNAAIFAHEAWASMHRIATFLAADEVDLADPLVRLVEENDKPLVEITKADFSWTARGHNHNLPTLHDIDFVVPRGSLTIIIGAVGSGKSSLMSALLGEMHQLRGDRVVRGGIAYASQQPWIQHNSVRENILFGSALDQDKYDAVLAACQLTRDLAMLEHGDATEIGERGINLSGGQKARVSLARVMYRLPSADILVLDDPLSALDIHVANAVFQQCVVGLAREKTRLLVLNAHYHLLNYADRVVVMANETIVGTGSLAQMQAAYPEIVGHSLPRQDTYKTKTDGDDVHTKSMDSNEDKPVPEAILNEEQAKKTQDSQTEPKSMMLAEDRAAGAITWRTYGEFLACSGWGSGLTLGIALLVAFAIGQCGIVVGDYYLTYWSDGTLRHTITSEKALLWGFVGITVVATLLSIARAAFLTEICVRSSSAMHAQYFEKVLMARISTFFDVTPVGQVLNRFSRDLDQVDNPLPYYGLALLVYLMLTLAILVVCAIATPTTAVLYVPLWYACYWLQKRFLATSRELKRLDGVTRSPYLNLVVETINGLESIRAFRMTEHFSCKCRELIDHNAKFYFMFQESSNWFVMRLDWLVTLVVVAVSFTVVAWQSSVGAASAGIALTYAVQLTMNFQRLMTRASSTDNFLTSFERLAYYDTLPTEGSITKHQQLTPTNWPTQGSIEFAGVWLRYREGLDCVLRGVSFKIHGGEKIGVCGRTGSGKSTLMNAIFRMVELSDGHVLIDGMDIADIPLRILRSRLTIIPQDPVLFSGTLRDNLDPFDERTDAELYAVLQRVRLADDVEKWGHGLSYAVVEKGENLSVGQRQLLCIARALLRESKIVLIDEATASVDQALDRLIQRAIKDNFRSCTTLTIAHRLETIVDSDRILVMEHGAVAEFGSPSALMSQKDGLFASLMASAQGH